MSGLSPPGVHFMKDPFLPGQRIIACETNRQISMEEKKVEILSPPFLFNCDVALPLVFSETNNRPKGGLQITVRAIVEIHFVADIQPQSDRPEVPFQTATSIESPHHVIFAQTGDRARKRSECRGRIIQAEIDEPAFSGNEGV